MQKTSKTNFVVSDTLMNAAIQQKPIAKQQVQKLSRKQRRAAEQDYKRRLSKGKRIIDGDYRWKKLNDEQKRQCLDAFKTQAEYTRFNQQNKFIVDWPMTPEMQAYAAEQQIYLAQETRYRWVCVVPAATATEVFDYKLNKAMAAKANCMFIASQDDTIVEYANKFEQVKHIVPGKETGTYAIVLNNDCLVNKHWHDDITIDEIILLDAIDNKRTAVTLHYSDDVCKLVERIADMFDIVDNVNALQTLYEGEQVLQLTIKYKIEQA